MRRTLHTYVDVTIERPADAVWAVVRDPAADARWRRGARNVTETAVTGTGPGRSYRFTGSGATGAARGGRSVQPAGDRVSVFRYDVEVEAADVSRLARPVLGWWLTHSLRRDVRRLRRVLERDVVECAAVDRGALAAAGRWSPA
jgi:hypothetical protein